MTGVTENVYVPNVYVPFPAPSVPKKKSGSLSKPIFCEERMSAEGILQLQNPASGSNSGQRMLQAQISGPNSWAESFATFFCPAKPKGPDNSKIGIDTEFATDTEFTLSTNLLLQGGLQNNTDSLWRTIVIQYCDNTVSRGPLCKNSFFCAFCGCLLQLGASCLKLPAGLDCNYLPCPA